MEDEEGAKELVEKVRDIKLERRRRNIREMQKKAKSIDF